MPVSGRAGRASRREDRDRRRSAGRRDSARARRRRVSRCVDQEARGPAQRAGAVHHLDAAARGVAQAEDARAPHDAGRAGALRRRRSRRQRGNRRFDHLHAHRLDAHQRSGARRGARVHRRNLRRSVSRRPAPQACARARRTRTKRSARPRCCARRERVAGVAQTRRAAPVHDDLGALRRVADVARRSSIRPPSTSAAGEYGFRATGTVMRFAGFTRVYEESARTSDERRRQGPRVRAARTARGAKRSTAASSSPSSTSPSRRRATPKRRWSKRSKTTASAGRRPIRRSSRRFRRAATSTQQERRFVPTRDRHGGQRFAGRALSQDRQPRLHRADGRRSRQGCRGARRLGRAAAPLLRAVRERAGSGREEACRGWNCATSRPTKSVRTAAVRWSSRPAASASSFRASAIPNARRPSRSSKTPAPSVPNDGGAIVERRSQKGPHVLRLRELSELRFRLVGSRSSPQRCPVCGSYVVAKTRRGGERSCNARPTASTTSRAMQLTTPARRRSALIVATCAMRSVLTVIGGGLAGCEAAWQAARLRRRGRSLRDAPACAADRRTRPAACRTRLQQLVARRRAGKCGRAAERRTRAARFADRDGRRAKRPFRPAARWRSIATGSRARSNAHLPRSRASHLHREEVRDDSARSSGDRRLRSVAAATSLLDVDRCRARRSLAEPARDAACTISMRRRRSSPPIRSTNRRCIASRATTKGDGDDYLNIPLDREQYAQLVARSCARSSASRPRISNRRRALLRRLSCRSKRWPIAATTTLRFGPLKPVGLARSANRNDAVRRRAASQRESRRHRIQSRRLSNAPDMAGAARGLRQAARTCANAEWLRLGVMHRNTFIDSPRLLDAQLKLRGSDGALLCRPDHRRRRIRRSRRLRRDGRHSCRARDARACRRSTFRARAPSARSSRICRTAQTHDFQPANVTWAPFPPLGTQRHGRDKTRAAAARWPSGRSRRSTPSLAAETLAGGRLGTDASMRIRSTTILAVRRDGRLAIAGDGQVTLDKTIVKHGARKVRKICRRQGAGRIRRLGCRRHHAAGEVREQVRRVQRHHARGGRAGQGLASGSRAAPPGGADDRRQPRASVLAVRNGRRDRARRGHRGDRQRRPVRAGGRRRAAAQYRARAPTRSRARRSKSPAEICIYTNDDITVETLP